MERGSGFYKYVDAKQGLNVYPLLLCWAPKNESNRTSVCFSHVRYVRAQSHCLFYICGLWHHELGKPTSPPIFVWAEQTGYKLYLREKAAFGVSPPHTFLFLIVFV